MHEPAAARAALNTYTAALPAERQEPRTKQVNDLILDLLLMFEADTANEILARVERDLPAEQDDATPVYRNV